MKNKKIKSGIIAAVGSAIVAGGGSAQTPENPLPTRGVADSVMLENRLKELAELPWRTNRLIAMCYSSAYILKTVKYTCPHCGKTTKVDDYKIKNLLKIEKLFKEIEAEGYDVVLDRREFCSKCSRRNKVEYPEVIFKIRFSEKGEYHIVKSNNQSDYITLLAFLQDRKSYTSNRGEKYLPEEIDVIQKMTGLGRDLIIKEKE